ncbi:MAG: DUF1905 domain-containing protein [Parcubacteria group bacterium]|nr:DUF1905 domain-containing protein [Parcubacteria group bacterium]
MPTKKNFIVKEKLHIFPMEAPWMYLPIPNDKVPNVRPGGWGSIPVMATVGKTTWRTSLFQMKKGYFFLPIKKQVCKKEDLAIGKEVTARYVLADK